MSDLPVPAHSATPPPPNRLPQETERLITLYLRTLTSPQTIKTYNTEIRLFAGYVGGMGKGLGELTPEDVSLYREHLIRTYAAATAAKKLAVLRRFLIFTFMAGATAVNPEALRFFAKSPRVRQDPAYNVLTEDELQRMLNAARSDNYRDYVMLATDELAPGYLNFNDAPLHVVGLRTADCKVGIYADWRPGPEARIDFREAQYEFYDYATEGGRLELDNHTRTRHHLDRPGKCQHLMIKYGRC